MYYVIGTLWSDNKMIGYKVYDSENKETGIFSRKSVERYVANGGTVVGLKIQYKYIQGDYILKRDKADNIKVVTSKSVYRVCLLDHVDEWGNPVNGPKTKVILSVKGLLRNVRVLTVDSLGQEQTIGYEELIQRLDEHTITGAKWTSDGLIFHDQCAMSGLMCDKSDDTYEQIGNIVQ